MLGQNSNKMLEEPVRFVGGTVQHTAWGGMGSLGGADSFRREDTSGLMFFCYLQMADVWCYHRRTRPEQRYISQSIDSPLVFFSGIRYVYAYAHYVPSAVPAAKNLVGTYSLSYHASVTCTATPMQGQFFLHSQGQK